MTTLPATWFGPPDDPTRWAHFDVAVDDRSDVYPDWETDLIDTTQHIPGSNRNDTFVSGFTPARITLPLEFDTRDDWKQFRRLWGTVGTLVLLAEFTSHDGEIFHDLDRAYEAFPNTLLLRIGRPAHRIGGQIEAEATFQRGFDPVTGQEVG
jgi:hypothetical protein